jgi:hypothetical protein
MLAEEEVLLHEGSTDTPSRRARSLEEIVWVLEAMELIDLTATEGCKGFLVSLRASVSSADFWLFQIRASPFALLFAQLYFVKTCFDDLHKVDQGLC